MIWDNILHGEKTCQLVVFVNAAMLPPYAKELLEAIT
jgi:hypothetical protein